MDKKIPFKRNRELVDLLIREKLITEEMLTKAREEVKRTGFTIENALEKLGFISEEEVVKAQANALGIPYIDLTDYVVDSELVNLIPENIARRHKVFPLFKIGNSITVGMVDPQDIVAIDQVRRLAQAEMVEPVLVSEKGLERLMNSSFGATGSIDEILKSIDSQKISEAERKGLMEVAEEAPIIRLANFLIAQAAKERASDIHIEPEESNVRVRFRIDGILHEMHFLPKKLQNAIISRIKILSKMDIAENRKPQDGRIQQRIENRNLDIRVSTFPTIHGENVVMRLLDKAAVLFGLKRIGFADEDFEVFEKLIKRPYGIVLVTGPTGSGKTSTLYAALTHINSTEKNIITIEDPVEYELPLVRQTQINPKADITFANGLRGILRQGPDIIMVGEIRDKETADIAIQAALTGHLVFSTLHTNDAPSALTRLVDMGIEPFLISSSVIGIAAQRLVKLICEKCREKYHPPANVLKSFGIAEDAEFYRGKGCGLCKGTGFVGRTGIFELLLMNEELKKLVDAKSSADVIRRKAFSFGLKTLRQDGLKKAQKGLTTLEEVLRVTELQE